MLTEEQLALRKKGIGSSEAAAIMGVGYQTPMDVWLRKCGHTDEKPTTEAMEWGNRLEQVVADKWAEEHPTYLLTEGKTHAHWTHDWMLATPDRLVHEEHPDRPPFAVLEIKTAGIRQLDQWTEAGVPLQYYHQVQWQMGVLDVGKAFVAALVGGQHYYSYTVARDDDLLAEMVQEAERFWYDHVKKEVPPPYDASPSSREWNQRIPLTSDNLKGTSFDLDHKLLTMKGLKVQVKEMEETIEIMRREVEDYIGQDAGCKGVWGTATWKPERGRVAWKKVAEKYGDFTPENIEEFREPTKRVLRIRWAKPERDNENQ